MVFRIIKNIFKTTVLLAIGAGIGIYFAPPMAKTVMKQKLAVAQKHTNSLRTDANKVWTKNLESKFVQATKSLDPRKIDRKMIDGWVQSGKSAVATISADAKRTQETFVKANQVIQSAKSEYQQFGTMFGM